MELYKSFVQSGPCYRLIVHDSPEWRRIVEEVADIEEILILTDADCKHYKELAGRYFSPIDEETGPYYLVNGKKIPSANFTADLKRVLSYILLGHDFKARIYNDDLLNVEPITDEMSKNNFSEDAISRAQFAESLISGYHRDDIPTLSVNTETDVLRKVKNILDKDAARELSGISHLFGILKADKNALKRSINEKITEGIKNKWFPDIVEMVTIGLSFYPDLEKVGALISKLSGMGAKVLTTYDFREYLPPIQELNILGSKGEPGDICTFSYQSFNDEIAIFPP
jgi:hypothetical protein